MAESSTTQLVNQKTLRAALGVGKWTIDTRIQRHPKGSPHPFPVERVGRHRRFDVAAVRAWFAEEANGFEADTATASAAA